MRVKHIRAIGLVALLGCACTPPWLAGTGVSTAAGAALPCQSAATHTIVASPADADAALRRAPPHPAPRHCPPPAPCVHSCHRRIVPRSKPTYLTSVNAPRFDRFHFVDTLSNKYTRLNEDCFIYNDECWIDRTSGTKRSASLRLSDAIVGRWGGGGEAWSTNAGEKLPVRPTPTFHTSPREPTACAPHGHR